MGFHKFDFIKMGKAKMTTYLQFEDPVSPHPFHSLKSDGKHETNRRNHATQDPRLVPVLSRPTTRDENRHQAEPAEHGHAASPKRSPGRSYASQGERQSYKRERRELKNR